MPTPSSSDPNLDYEDLVQELDQFEQQASVLQEKISAFMTDAQAAAYGDEGGGQAEAEAAS